MLADTALLEKCASLGEVVRKLLRRKLLSRTWIGVRAPLTGTRLKAPSFFIEGEELRAFAAEKEGGDLLSVQDCCLEIAKRVAGGEGLEGLHRDLCRQRDASMRVWWNEKQGEGGYGLYGLEWEHDYLGARRLQGYDCWEVG